MIHPLRTPSFASRILRGALITLLLLPALALVLLIIMYDADLYAVRDKYEHAKAALFGEWQATAWCPPGRTSKTCKNVDAFEQALSEATNFTFFKNRSVEGTALSVTTGVRFATARDVLDKNAASAWCYLDMPDGQTSVRIDLAEQSAQSAPKWADVSALSSDTLDSNDLSGAGLMRLARSHCQFSVNAFN